MPRLIRAEATLALLCLFAVTKAQTGGVESPPSYAEFSVIDCFRDSVTGKWKEKKPLPPNDVMKGTAIWRTVGLGNRQNRFLLSTNAGCTQISLIEVIKFGLFELKLPAFSSDAFSGSNFRPLAPGKIRAALFVRDSSEVVVFDEAGNESKEIKIEKRFLMARDIVNYLVKEDWIINSHSGRLERHIVALAPLARDRKTELVTPLFWLYYPEWAELFASFQTKAAFGGELITYKEVFERNLFVSQVSKTTNVFDRPVKATQHGSDVLVESEVIKEKVRNEERDLFQH